MSEPATKRLRLRTESIRWEILRALDVSRPGFLPVSALQLALDARGYKLSDKELEKELEYLQSRKLVAVQEGGHENSVRLRWMGIDLVEYTVECEPGIARPPHLDPATRLRKANVESSRWYILRALDAGRPGAVKESLLLMALGDSEYQLNPDELRRELEYLELRELITIKIEADTWLPRLDRLGIELVEYTIPCWAGIKRPEEV